FRGQGGGGDDAGAVLDRRRFIARVGGHGDGAAQVWRHRRGRGKEGRGRVHHRRRVACPARRAEPLAPPAQTRPGGKEGVMQPIRKILAPVDFSACSEEAARYAVELAGRLGAQVTLFNAYFFPVSVPFPDGSAYIPSAESLAELAGAAERDLRAIRDRVQ